MKQAEKYIHDKIGKAFSEVKSSDVDFEFNSWKDIPDPWIKENEDLFAYYSHQNEIFLLPAYLCYLLKNFEETLNSVIYMHIEGTLREYSKEKGENSFKSRLNGSQFGAIADFIKHYLNNQPVNIDKESWSKTLKRWVR